MIDYSRLNSRILYVDMCLSTLIYRWKLEIIIYLYSVIKKYYIIYSIILYNESLLLVNLLHSQCIMEWVFVFLFDFQFFFGLDSNYVMLSFISVLTGVVQNLSCLENQPEERQQKMNGKNMYQTEDRLKKKWVVTVALLTVIESNKCSKHTKIPHKSPFKMKHMLFFSGLSDDLHFLSFKEFRNRTLGTLCMTLLKATLCVRNREKSLHSCATGIFVCRVVFCVFMAIRVDLF